MKWASAGFGPVSAAWQRISGSADTATSSRQSERLATPDRRLQSDISPTDRRGRSRTHPRPSATNSPAPSGPSPRSTHTRHKRYDRMGSVSRLTQRTAALRTDDATPCPVPLTQPTAPRQDCHGLQITELPPTPLALPGGKTVHVTTRRWALERWEGEPDPADLKHSWASKPRFSVNAGRSDRVF